MPGHIQVNFGVIRIFSFRPSQFTRSKALHIDGFAGWIHLKLLDVSSVAATAVRARMKSWLAGR